MVEINCAGDGGRGDGCGVAERGIADDVAGADAIEVLRLRRYGGVVETCGVGAGQGDLGEVYIVGRALDLEVCLVVGIVYPGELNRRGSKGTGGEIGRSVWSGGRRSDETVHRD